jgi:ribosome recycling factor
MMFAQKFMSQKELQEISSKKAVQKLLETKSVDYYQMVEPVNRIGTIIYWIVEQRKRN